MTTDTPAAAAITAEREALNCPFCGLRAYVEADFGREWWVQCTSGHSTGILHANAAAALEEWSRRAALSAPVAAQPVASGMDAQWVDEDRFRHRFEHWCTGGDSRNLPAIERSGAGGYRLMQTQSDWVAWLAAREALSKWPSKTTTTSGSAKPCALTCPDGNAK